MGPAFFLLLLLVPFILLGFYLFTNIMCKLPYGSNFHKLEHFLGTNGRGLQGKHVATVLSQAGRKLGMVELHGKKCPICGLVAYKSMGKVTETIIYSPNHVYANEGEAWCVSNLKVRQ